MTDLNDDGRGSLATAVVFLFLANLAVMLRVFTRREQKIERGWDDWSIFVAVFFFHIYIGLALWGRSRVKICF